MTEIDDDTTRMLADAAVAFLQSAHRPDRLRAVYERKTVIDRAFWRELAGQGWLALRLPETLGGSGLLLQHASVIAEALGRHAVPEPVVACAMLPAALAQALPGVEWQAVQQGLVDGGHVCTLAWQGQLQSMAASACGVTVTSDKGGQRLAGRSFGVVAAGFADSLLVVACGEGEASLWHVPRNAEGVELHDALGSDGGSVAVIDFCTSVPTSALLARGAAVTAALDGAIAEATLLSAFQLLGAGSAALGLTLDHLRTRVQFGRAIGSFQSLQHLAVDVRVQLALARAGCTSALQRHAQAPAATSTLAAIAAAKARSSDAALQAARFAVQAHGAIGCAAECEVGLHLKTALRQSAWLGNAAQQRRRFGELSAVGEG